MITRCILIGALALTAAACNKVDRAPTPPPAASTAAASQDLIAAAVANPNRLAADLAEDSWRKPEEVLRLLQVQPGAQVLDYFSAAGYFTELLSYAVGPQGKVIAYNNEPYFKFAGPIPAQRYGNGRLANVTQLTQPPEGVTLEPESLDAVLFMLSYHDLYWRPKQAGDWVPTEPAQALQKLVPALKKGATVVVVDHAASAGSDPLQTVDALHRIDPGVVKDDFAAAGLALESESAMLSNAQDDHSKPVFDPAIRHQTDRFVYRFKKP